jgi:mannose-6-phosphate isomerase-like protein (cupin superfamily)
MRKRKPIGEHAPSNQPGVAAESHEQWRATVERAETLPLPEGERSVPILAHGSMLLKFYAPHGKDEQTPHTRDELYVVARGSGTFARGGEHHPFGPGDVLFVPAGMEHRFEDFTEDFATWVIFYGPEGGEGAKRRRRSEH